MVHAVIDRDDAAGRQQIRDLPGLQAAQGDRIDRVVLGPVPRDADRVVEARVHLVAAEDEAAHEAAALGDSDLRRDVA